MARFELVHDERPLTGRKVILVVDREDDSRPVARFTELDEATAHAARLNAGPLDWDEQEAWKDEWDDDQQATG